LPTPGVTANTCPRDTIFWCFTVGIAQVYRGIPDYDRLTVVRTVVKTVVKTVVRTVGGIISVGRSLMQILIFANRSFKVLAANTREPFVVSGITIVLKMSAGLNIPEE
jgi:hypothetical protein